MSDTPARTRVPTVYELSYEAPPPAPNAGNGRGALYAVLERLMADTDHHGEWALIAASKSRSGANSILTGIKQEKRRIPAPVEHFEFTARTNSQDNTSNLFARYVGEEGAAERKAANAKRRTKRAAAASA